MYFFRNSGNLLTKSLSSSLSSSLLLYSSSYKSTLLYSFASSFLASSSSSSSSSPSSSFFTTWPVSSTSSSANSASANFSETTNTLNQVNSSVSTSTSTSTSSFTSTTQHKRCSYKDLLVSSSITLNSMGGSVSSLYWPTSQKLLADSEAALLHPTPYTVKDVVLDSSGERVIHTLIFKSNTNNSENNTTTTTTNKVESKSQANSGWTLFNNNSNNITTTTTTTTTNNTGVNKNFVLTHGFGAGVGVFFKNYPALASIPGLTVYSIDWLGMGGSSRPTFSAKTAEEAEEFFINALEEWREKMGLDSFILGGHSLGGYLSTVYALKYPHRVSKLILISPVGIPKKPEEYTNRILASRPWLATTIQKLWDLNITPQSIVRFSGHFGPSMVNWFISKRFDMEPADQLLFQKYIYHISAASCSGELAFNTILSFGAWARRPLIERMTSLKMPTTFIYGLHDWMDKTGAVAVSKVIEAPAEIITISGGGHQMYFENYRDFNKILTREIANAPLFPPVSIAVNKDANTTTNNNNDDSKTTVKTPVSASFA